MTIELETKPANGPFEAVVNSKFSLVSTGPNECNLAIYGTIKYLEYVASIIKRKIRVTEKATIRHFKPHFIFFYSLL